MQHQIHLELNIRFDSVWHTGSGEGSFLADRLIQRDAMDRPFVPASTLKGIVRQSCEKISRTLTFPFPSDPHQSDLTVSNNFKPFKKIDSPIDQIFGTKYEPGGLFFRDARLLDEQQQLPCVVRNRVTLSRALKTAKENHLFNTEYASPSTLKTKIDGWHDGLCSFGEEYPPFAYCLLIAGILSVERIGGDKSTGGGWIDGPISIQKAIYNENVISFDDDFFELLSPDYYQEMRGES